MPIWCKIAAWTLLMLVSACQPAALQHSEKAFEAVYDYDGGGLRATEVVAKKGLLLAETERYGREFVAQSLARGLRYSELRIVEDAHALMPTVFLTEKHTSFQDTLNQLSQDGLITIPSRPIARVVQIESAALLTFREGGKPARGKGLVHEIVIAGDHDPSQIRLKDHGVLRLLVLSSSQVPKPGSLHLKTFFQSEVEPTCAICMEAGKAVNAWLHPRNLEIEVRQDTWFCSMSFPRFFPFASDDGLHVYTSLVGVVVAPTIEQYYRQTHTTCKLVDGVANQCESYGRRERFP